MIQAQVMQYHEAPILILELTRNISGNIIIHLCEILNLLSAACIVGYVQGKAYRNKKAGRAVIAVESFRK